MNRPFNCTLEILLLTYILNEIKEYDYDSGNSRVEVFPVWRAINNKYSPFKNNIIIIIIIISSSSSSSLLSFYFC